MSQHYGLNAKQIHTLILVYKFRFVTAPLLAEYKGLSSRHAMYEHLELLAKQGYLAKRIDTNELFSNKGGRYCLTTKAMRLLRTEHDIPERNLRVMYKNHSVLEEFVHHQVQTMKVFLILKKACPDKFKMFTKSELARFDYFPKPLPDICLIRKSKLSSKPNEYMLDLLIDLPMYLMKKRVDTYIMHYDSGDWTDGSGGDYPVIILVCPNLNTEKRLKRYIETALEDRGMDEELFFYSITPQELVKTDILL